MAEREFFELDADATGLVRALEQATEAFIRFGSSTARIQRDIASVDKDGNILARRLIAIDAAGNKVAGTFKVLESGLLELVGATASAAGGLSNLTTTSQAAAAAQVFLQQATALNAEVVREAANAFAAEAAALQESAIKNETAAAQHLANAEATKNSGAAAAAYSAQARKAALSTQQFADALEFEELAAIEAAKALTLEAEALALRNRAAGIIRGGQEQIARRPAVQQQLTQRRTDEDKTQKKFQDNQRKAEEDRVKAIQKQQELRIAAENRVAAEFRRVSAERATTEKQIIAQREADEKRVAAEFVALDKQRSAEKLAADKQAIAEGLALNKRAEAERVAALKSQAEQRLAAERRVAAEFAALDKRQNAEKLAADKRVIAENLAANQKAEAERLAAIKRQAEQRLAAERRVAAEFIANVKREEAAKLASDRKIIEARATAARKEEEARLAELKRRTAQRIADENRVAALFKTLDAQRAAQGLPTRPAGLDLRTVSEGGKATEQQVRAFLQAEAAAQKLVATTKVGSAEMAAALQAARNGTLQLASATTEAERAAYRLVAAEKQVAAGAAQARVSADSLLASIKNLGSLIGISFLIGGAFRLVSAFTQAAEQAGEFSIKIAEIETITKDNSFATEAWAEGLRNLSNEFGLDIVDQARGAYQILSNQIRNAAGEAVNGAEALEFLRVANQLAITGVTDTASATNLLTSVINSFRLSAEDAGIVSAQLFKVVELGRLRIEEMSDTFGRLAVPANQLGLSLAEVGGAIAQATIQGVKFNEASTLVRNVILKLIRPTDQMKEVFSDLGVASGEALIASRGFVGALEAIESRVGGTSTELGEAFGRIRAITGALIFAGKGAEETAAKIEEIRTATIEAFSEDTNRIIQSTGKQLEIAGEQARNFFERELGTPAIEAINKFIQAQGGIEEVIRNTVDSLASLSKILAVVYGAKTIRAIGAFTAAQLSAAGATVAVERAALALNTALASTPVGVALVIGGSFAALTEIFKNATREQLREVERQNLEIERKTKDRNNRILALEQLQTQQTNLEIDRRIQTILRGFADVRIELNKNAKELEENAVTLTSRFDDSIRNFNKAVNAQLASASKGVRDFSKDVEDAAEKTREILNQSATVRLEIDLETAGIGQRFDILNDEINRAQAELEATASTGNLEIFEEQRKQVNELLKQRVAAEIELAKLTARIQDDLIEARADRQRATSRQDRELADDRIKSLERELEIAENGTKTQLDFERKLQEAREKFRTASTQEEFKTALESLNDLEREQRRVNAVADAERQIREDTARALEDQARLVEEIRQIQAKRAEEARAEETRVRSLQFLFNLISQEAEDFSNKRITEGKNEEEINKAVAEQQARFSQLITLSRELSGSRANDAIFIQRDTQLRAEAENTIAKLRNANRQEEIKARKDEAEAALKTLRSESDLQDDLFKSILGRVEALRDAASSIQPARAVTFDGEEGIRQSRGDVAALAFNQITELNARNTKSIENTLDVISGLTKQIIALIAEQRLEPTFERGQQIRAQVAVVQAALQNIAARQQQTTGPRPNILFAAQTEETRKRINELRDSIAPAVGAFGQLDTVLQKLLKNDGLINSIVSTLDQTDLVETRGPLTPEELRKISLQGLTPEETARELVKQLNTLIRAPEQPTGVPGQVQPVQLEAILPSVKDVLSKETAEGLQEGLERAAPKINQLAQESGRSQGRAAAEETFKQSAIAGQTTGKAQAQANADESIKQAPKVQTEIDRLRADSERRLAQIRETELQKRRRPEPTGPQIDTSIRFGPGAPSIQEQELKIQQQLNDAAEKRLNIVKAELEEEKRLAALKAAAASGQTFTNAQGQIFTRQATTAERERAVAEPDINPVEQARAAEALRLARGGGAEDILKIQEQLTNARAEELSEIQTNLEIAKQLGIEDERALELARDQNNISQAAQDATAGFVKEINDIVAAQTTQPGLQPRDATRDELTEALIAREDAFAQGVPVIQESNRQLQESLDKLRLTIDTFSSTPVQPSGFAHGGRVFGPGGIDKVPAMLTAGEYVVRAQQAAKFMPTLDAINAGRVEPRGYADGGIVTNMGGIRITVNESSSPQATANEVVSRINRGIRNGTLKIRKN